MTQASEPKRVAPFGAWDSPFASSRLIDGVVFLAEVLAEQGVRWWLEGRPDEGGRQVLVRRDPDGSTVRLSPVGFNVRSRVHEYGGAASLVVPAADLVVVSDFATGRLHRIVRPGETEPLTPDRAWRFADAQLDAVRGRLIAVREDHEPEVVAGHGEWLNDLVAIDLASGDVTVIASGADFYAAPRLAPDGRSLAWIEWDHPNMPWDGTRLRLGEVRPDGSLGPAETIAGGPADWIGQPRWSPDGVLHFAAEPDGWMNLFRRREGRIEPLAPMAVEFHGPEWQFGASTYGFLADGSILAVGRSGGRDRLYRIVGHGVAEEVVVPYTEMSALAIDADRVVLRASSPTEPNAIVELDPSSGSVTVLRRSTPDVPDPLDVAVGRPIEFPTTGGLTARGLFYAPTSRAFRGPDGELPPLVVTSHGGPTSSAWAAYSTLPQLFASRGIAVLDVDYGGSTGYGRAYRRRLEGEWGVVDVDDCVAGAGWLAERGLVDADRLAIRGGSASGYTTLCAITFRDVFRAGVSMFGIGNLEGFVGDTHKFESRYVERLVGPYPERRDLYQERSPVFHAERIHVPALILQGLDDRVVPPSEAERIVDALWERHVPHAYLAFEGEDHGFRQAPNIIRAFEAELSFYGQVFDFRPADPIEPLEITFLEPVGDRTGR